MRTSRPVFLALMCGMLALPWACSSDDPNKSDSSGTPNGSSTGASGGIGEGGSGAGTPTAGQGGAGGVFNPTNSSGMGGSENCLTTEEVGETLPLDLLIVLDRSKSMADQGLWQPTLTAITQFVQDQANQGVSVGMTFFPKAGANDSCNLQEYTPPHLGFTALPMNAQQVVDAMNAQTPAGLDTPTYGALYGSLQFANTYQDMNPNRVVAVALASDGIPNSCPGTQNDTSEIAKIAKTAFEYNGVRTFVIAIAGAIVKELDIIAAAGGTTAALDVTMNINLLKTKLDEIRANVLGCAYAIPEPMGQDFDKTKLNLEYTPGGSMVGQEIPQAANLQDCGMNDGWYYDNPADPKTILLCPKTCDTISQDTGAKISFVFGCPTVVN